MRCKWFATVALVGGVVLGAASAGAQPSIDTSARQATTPLTQPQAASVTAWARHWTDELATGDAARVAEARNQLNREFAAGGTSVYQSFLSSTLSRHLAPLASSKVPLVGVNAMLVAGRLSNGVVPVVQAALNNEDVPAVRYLAGRAIDSVTANAAALGRPLQPADLQKLLQALEATTPNEASTEVLRSLLPAYVVLPIPEAVPAVLKRLSARVPAAWKDPGVAVEPSTAALERLVRRLIDDRIAGRLPDPVLADAARVAYRNLALALHNLNTEAAPAEPNLKQIGRAHV